MDAAFKWNGSPGRTRTCDKSVNSRLLYQLSYRGMAGARGGPIAGAADDARTA